MKTMTTLKFQALLGTMILTSSLSAFSMGGMSGGGGCVIAPKPPEIQIDPELVEGMVKSSRQELIQYLDQKQEKFRSGTLTQEESDLFSPLFNGKKDILETIRETRLNVEDDAPCYDRSHAEVDGSIFSHKKGAICISSLTISKKVHQDEVTPQSASLLLHEYAEVAGADEDHAVALQIHVLNQMKSTLASPMSMSSTDSIKATLASVMKSMGQKLKAISAQASDVSKNAQSALLADEFVALSTTAKGFNPDPARKDRYDEMMDQTIQLGQQLGAAFRAGDNSKALQILQQLSVLRGDGHGEFKN